MLGPIAAYMNDYCQTGLISKGDLLQKLIQQLEVQKISTENAKNFLEALIDKVGLLVERGDRMFGFLHLTFQEYLAALGLLAGGTKQARENILKKLSNPRWHESILLGRRKIMNNELKMERK